MKNQFNIYLFSFLALILFSTSCSSSDIFCVKGKGNTKTQVRQVASFTAVESLGSFTVHLFQDSSITTQEVTISAQENIINLIKTRISGQSLIIDTDECYTTKEEVIITIRTPALSQIVLAGSGDIILKDTPRTTTNLELILDGSGTIRTTPNFPIIASSNCTAKMKGSGTMELELQSTTKVNASISGSGKITLRGTANENDLSITGSGDIKAFSLPVLKSKADITGSGRIEISAIDTTVPSRATVNAKISGSGSIYIKGNAIVESNVSGSGKVERVN